MPRLSIPRPEPKQVRAIAARALIVPNSANTALRLRAQLIAAMVAPKGDNPKKTTRNSHGQSMERLQNGFLLRRTTAPFLGSVDAAAIALFVQGARRSFARRGTKVWVAAADSRNWASSEGRLPPWDALTARHQSLLQIEPLCGVRCAACVDYAWSEVRDRQKPLDLFGSSAGHRPHRQHLSPAMRWDRLRSASGVRTRATCSVQRTSGSIHCLDARRALGIRK